MIDLYENVANNDDSYEEQIPGQRLAKRFNAGLKILIALIIVASWSFLSLMIAAVAGSFGVEHRIEPFYIADHLFLIPVYVFLIFVQFSLLPVLIIISLIVLYPHISINGAWSDLHAALARFSSPFWSFNSFLFALAYCSVILFYALRSPSFWIEIPLAWPGIAVMLLLEQIPGYLPLYKGPYAVNLVKDLVLTFSTIAFVYAILLSIKLGLIRLLDHEFGDSRPDN